jgi:hypothetical protein
MFETEWRKGGRERERERESHMRTRSKQAEMMVASGGWAVLAVVVVLQLAGGANTDCFDYAYKNCITNDKSMADYCNLCCETGEEGKEARGLLLLGWGGNLWLGDRIHPSQNRIPYILGFGLIKRDELIYYVLLIRDAP